LNDTEWSSPIPVSLDTPTKDNYISLLEKYDDKLFSSANDDGIANYGNYFYYKIDQANA
jgi:hypothetical protein